MSVKMRVKNTSINKSIKTIQICCGEYHSLILSNANKIYAFGWNEYYSINVLTPQLNEILKNENIITIKCGVHHNMVKNRKNEYYLWGDNEYNQCIVRSRNPPSYVQ
eukprot:261929_1